MHVSVMSVNVLVLMRWCQLKGTWLQFKLRAIHPVCKHPKERNNPFDGQQMVSKPASDSTAGTVCFMQKLFGFSAGQGCVCLTNMLYRLNRQGHSY